jgi:SAM-dependent methyltransferase
VSHHAGLGVTTLIVRCGHCHGVYPRPALLPNGNPYDEHSSAEYFHAHDAAQKAAAGQALAERATRLLGRTGRLLELGCGRGELLVGASRAGWSTRGVEMTQGFAEAARAAGVGTEIASVETCQSLDEEWDAVLLAAVLEHLYEPRVCLERVFDALTPGGVVFIDVPNECSLWTRLGNAYMRARGRRWAVNLSPTFPPFHVVGFCPRSLRRLLGRVGFEVIELRTHRWRNELPRRDSLGGKLEHLGAEAALYLGSWIGSGAGITAWARKPLGAGTRRHAAHM